MRSMRKYRNVPVDGYDSKAERDLAVKLKAMERQGIIKELREQVPYTLIPKQEGERAVKYIADFVFIDSAGETVVMDKKGRKTRDYIIKRKLMRWVHKIKVQEV